MIRQKDQKKNFNVSTYLPKEEQQYSYPTGKTALLVIDPVNDFLSEGGAAWELTKSTVKLHDVVGNLKRAIEGARAERVPVIFGPMAYTEEDYADNKLHRRSGINRPMYERKMFLAGRWGADFHPALQPLNTDIVLLPHKGTDVFETDLPDYLQKMGITHLVIVGMTASLCCDSTGRHAAEAGYDVTYLYDAIGAESVPSCEAAVNLNYPLTGNTVIKAEEFLEAIGSRSIWNATVKMGDKVYGSDHLKIGNVSEIVEANSKNDACLIVKKGKFFNKRFYIPLDAVVRKIKTKVFINVPRAVISKMPWNEMPSIAKREDKRGKSSSTVGMLYRSRSPSSQE
jgi:ureidoacrylate peracid hydrolase